MSDPTPEPPYWGTRRVTAVLLLFLALIGLWLVPSQIEVFALESQWPDARTLPTAYLALLVLALLLRSLLELRKSDYSLGSVRAHLRGVGLILSLVVGLGVMIVGYGAAGLALIAVLVAPILSTGPALKPTISALTFALLAYALAVVVLRIPLH